VIGSAPVGVLDEDLRRACLEALASSRKECRAFALKMTWQASARIFLDHVAQGNRVMRRRRPWLKRRRSAALADETGLADKARASSR